VTTGSDRLRRSLQRILERDPDPAGWCRGGDFPWGDPDFGRRALGECLDESHAGGSRPSLERQLQIDWLWHRLELVPGQRLLDAGCGPGHFSVELARRGLSVLGIDLNSAAIEHARDLAAAHRVAARCEFCVADMRKALIAPDLDVVLLLYGQLGPLPRSEAERLLRALVASLRPGGCLVLDALDPANIERSGDAWWFSGEGDVWSEGSYLNLGERFWNEEGGYSVERTLVLHLATGELDEYELCDQSWEPEQLEALLLDAGCSRVEVCRAWDGLELDDASDWIAYVARR
jgi:SAM-dependent methyltransferase